MKLVYNFYFSICNCEIDLKLVIEIAKINTKREMNILIPTLVIQSTLILTSNY